MKRERENTIKSTFRFSDKSFCILEEDAIEFVAVCTFVSNALLNRNLALHIRKAYCIALFCTDTTQMKDDERTYYIITFWLSCDSFSIVQTKDLYIYFTKSIYPIDKHSRKLYSSDTLLFQWTDSSPQKMRILHSDVFAHFQWAE